MMRVTRMISVSSAQILPSPYSKNGAKSSQIEHTAAQQAREAKGAKSLVSTPPKSVGGSGSSRQGETGLSQFLFLPSRQALLLEHRLGRTRQKSRSTLWSDLVDMGRLHTRADHSEGVSGNSARSPAEIPSLGANRSPHVKTPGRE